MAFGTLRYAVADGVATITLDQPDTRNALSDELLDDLIGAFEAARDDDAVRCVVLTSSHEKVFSSGGNLGGLRRRRAARAQARGHRALPALFALIGELGKPTLCAANGHVLAGRARARAGVRPDRRARGRALRDARDQRRRLPVHDHGADLPQRRAQEDERAAAARRADLRRGGRADRDRQPRRAGRRVRRRGRRLGGEAGGEVAGADADGQGRDVPPAGHGVRGRARLPARAADDRVRHRGHPGGRQGVLREARARRGRAGDAAVVALLCRTSDRTPGGARGAEALAPRLARAARRRGADDRLARRAARAAASPTTCASRAAACSRPAARSTTRSPTGASRSCSPRDCSICITTLPTVAAPPPRGARRSGSTRTATSTRPRRRRAASSAACAWPPRAGAGTPGWATASSTPRGSS